MRPATVDDARRIVPLLRQQDVREIRAASGVEPGAILPLAFSPMLPGEKDTVFAETTDGAPILIGGVREDAPGSAIIWMVGTDLLDDYAFPCGREARRKVNEWNRRWPRLWNTAWADNDLHVRWLTFMGFTLRGTRKGPLGHTFIDFERLRHVR